MAVRGARARAGGLSLSMVGVAVALAFVVCTNIVTSTLAASFDELFSDVYGRIDVVVQGRFGGNGSVEAAFGGAHSVVEESLVDKVRSVPGAGAVAGQVQQQVAVLTADGQPLNASGFPPTFGMNWLTEPELNGWVLDEGLPPTKDGEAVIDVRMARALGVHPGQTVRVVGVDGSVRALVLVGVASFGQQDSYAGSSAVITTTPTAQRLFLQPGRFNWISVKAQRGVGQAQLSQRVREAVPASVKAYTGREFTKQAQRTFGGLVDLLSRFLLAFAFVAVAVGAYSIFNTFSILGAQRQREVALLRVIGASRSQVARLVLIEAAMVGAVAALGGVVLGVVVARLLQLVLQRSGVVLSGTGLEVPVAMLGGWFVAGVTLTVVAAFLPAWKAARTRPIVALRENAAPEVVAPGVRLLVGLSMLGYGGLSVMRSPTGPDAVIVVAEGLAAAFAGLGLVSPLLWGRLTRQMARPLVRVGGFVALLAGRNSSRQAVRTARVGAVIVTGVALVAMFAVMTASLSGASAAQIRAGTRGDLVVHPDLASGGTVDPVLAERLKDVQGVETIAGARFAYTEIDDVSGLAIGIDPAVVTRFFDVRVVAGSLGRLGGNRVALDSKIAGSHGWHVGTVVTGEFVQAGYEKLEIGALFEGTLPIDGMAVLMPAADFDRRVPPVQRGDALVYLKLRGDAEPIGVRARVAQVVSDHPLMKVETVEQFATTQVAAADTFVNIVTGLLLIALVVAFVGVGNTLVLSVLERFSEIGFLRAVGMQRRQVRLMIEWEGLQIGLLGAVMGILVGVAAGWALTRAVGGDLPISVPWVRLALSAGLTTVLSVVAAVPPALRAGRLPVLGAISAA